MTHPYRELPPAEPARGADDGLAWPTVCFGFVCVLAGCVLGGPACGLVATMVGVVLILSPGRPPR